MDADGESIGAGGLFIDGKGHRWEVLARDIKVNRAGADTEHSLASTAAKVRDLALTHERAYGWGNITLSLGFADVESAGDTILEDGVRGFLTWRREIR